MWPCTHTVEMSLMTNATVAPAWITWPGSTSFCTTVPDKGARIGRSDRIATFCRSASCKSCWFTPRILSACSAVSRSVPASL